MLKFIKDWMLILAMVAGAGIYLFYLELPALHVYGPQLLSLCKTLQPVFLFMMLFLSFCKIPPSQLKFRSWMPWLLAVQALAFVAGTFVILHFGVGSFRIPLESFMLCMICPTATAAAVITSKLGGDMAGVVSYTILVNLMVALVVPAVVPLLYPAGEISFWSAFLQILSKVFPLLIMPAFAAWLLRLVCPGLHKWFLSRTGMAFYIWAVSLSLAILMSTRAIVHSGASLLMLGGIALGSLAACVLQFWFGHLMGSRHDSCATQGGSPAPSAGTSVSESFTAGQSMGQKNTVFAIWMGYTFMDPLVSVAGGFYSIWHNIYNTAQLRKKSKNDR